MVFSKLFKKKEDSQTNDKINKAIDMIDSMMNSKAPKKDIETQLHNQGYNTLEIDIAYRKLKEKKVTMIILKMRGLGYSNPQITTELIRQGYEEHRAIDSVDIYDIIHLIKTSRKVKFSDRKIKDLLNALGKEKRNVEKAFEILNS